MTHRRTIPSVVRMTGESNTRAFEQKQRVREVAVVQSFVNLVLSLTSPTSQLASSSYGAKILRPPDVYRELPLASNAAN